MKRNEMKQASKRKLKCLMKLSVLERSKTEQNHSHQLCYICMSTDCETRMCMIHVSKKKHASSSSCSRLKRKSRKNSLINFKFQMSIESLKYASIETSNDIFNLNSSKSHSLVNRRQSYY